MTPEQTRAIEEWWARHPGLSSLIRVMVGILVVGGVLVFTAMIFTGIRQGWPTWQAYYQYAGGWSLRLETPTDPPVIVDPGYQSQEQCESTREWKMQRAYHSDRSIPSLSCVPTYQGWRRLLYAWQATGATRASEEEVRRKELQK
jgi:hypothetical protein